MPLYEYTCEPCDRVVEIRRDVSAAGKPVWCANCGDQLQRVYSFSYTMPGRKDADSWNAWYEGKEAAVGMTRERTQQLARHHYQQSKNNPERVTAPRTISTPSHPAVRPPL